MYAEGSLHFTLLQTLFEFTVNDVTYKYKLPGKQSNKVWAIPFVEKIVNFLRRLERKPKRMERDHTRERRIIMSALPKFIC